MINKIYDYSEKKDFRSFAWELYSGVKNGDISIVDLVELFSYYFRKELIADNMDEDPWEYIKPDNVARICFTYACVLFEKQLADGKWACSNDKFTDGMNIISMDDILDAFVKGSLDDPYDIQEEYQREIEALDQIKPDHKPQYLDLFDHITKENCLAVLNLAEYLHHRRRYTLDELKEEQDLWVENTTKEYLPEAVARIIHTTFCYFFLEQATFSESEEVSKLQNRLETVKTVKEAIFTISELDFWLQTRPMVPYSAYMYITGRIDDRELLTEEEIIEEIDFTTDPSLAEELKPVLEKAVAGDPDAQNMMSKMYLSGENVDKDEKRAAYWLRKAADQGVP